MKKAGAPAIKVRVESSAVDGALGSASAARAAPARKRAREPDEFDAAPAVSSRAAVDDDDEYDLPPEVTFREGGSSGAAAGPRAAADAAAAAMGSASAIGIGAIVPYSGGATGGPGGGLFSGAPARPIAITKHGVRQFVETSHGVRLFLQNCVASTDLRCSPDLAHIATHARNAEYNPQRFSAVILRIREPKATALVFQSGKMVLTGSKNEEDALLASRTVAKIIMVRFRFFLTRWLGHPLSQSPPFHNPHPFRNLAFPAQ
jgi:hypothetical protein